MEYFLDTIAGSLYREFGNTLNRHCLVFPNRRAGLFFLKYLAARIDKPVWEPSVLTVNELFRSHSSLQITGNEVLLFELYKVYRKLKKSAESFDNFFFWGDILLNDFDDIDKYLVKASMLFSNVLDIKNIDQQFGGMNEQQIGIVKKFWLNFNPEKPTGQKEGFLSIWSVLNDTYTEFRSSLRRLNIAYEGMIFRDIAENSEEQFSTGVRWDMIHFIGFNALNECEKIIMTRLKKIGKARFYWDYDESYISGTGSDSAGYFMQDNLRRYGNDMPEEFSFKSLLTSTGSDVKRRIIDTSSDVAQVKLVPDLLNEIPGLAPENAHQTAVILADENLLIPMLSSLPENIGDVNITMGYPLKQTQVYTLVRNLMDLQRDAVITDGIARFRYRDVAGILKNPLIALLNCESADNIIEKIRKSNLLTVPENYFNGNETLSQIFVKPALPVQLSDYFRNILTAIAIKGQKERENVDRNTADAKILNEFIYRIVLSINRLEAIVKSEDVIFSVHTYMAIFDRLLRIQSVPFAGEPLSGIQIMGILETRALDFKNLLILSLNDGVLPAVTSPSSSYIPFSLREAFGLPSINHQESIYAYHFYRLLQRAENVTFIYNSNSDGLKSGEMSRFLIQMMYDPVLKPEQTGLSLEIRSHGKISDVIERREEHNQQLLSQYISKPGSRLLSPSAINMWLNCRMKFFYRYVNHLMEPSEIKTEIDHSMLGNILHEIMKLLYNDYEGKVLNKEYLESLLMAKQILSVFIENAIRMRFHGGEERVEHGNEIIVRDVLITYLSRILNADISFSPVQLISLEKEYSFPLEISSGGKYINISVGGVVDRIDIINDIARVVDYKTGTVADSISSLSDLFDDDRKKETDGWLQTLLYCETVYGKISSDAVRPSIYKIKKNSILSDKLTIKTNARQEILIENYADIRRDFKEGLTETIGLIFSDDEPFRMTSDSTGKCRYCVYKALCMR